MDTIGQCVFSKSIPTDILVQVGEEKFPLHKMMLVAKSNYIRRLILESKEVDLERIDLPNIPGGAEIFRNVAKFCYGVSFEITIHNVAALRCAAYYLEMTDDYCDDNLANRTYAFLVQVALTSLSGAITVLKTCEQLLPIAEQINIVHQCVEVASAMVCDEATFPTCSPPNWWTEEVSRVHIASFTKIVDSMKSKGANSLTIGSAITTYAKRSLRDIASPISRDSTSRIEKREILDSLVALFPVETPQEIFSVNFLCSLLRTAILLENNESCKKQLEMRISCNLENVTVDDLLILSYAFDEDRLCDMESVKRIISGFMEKEKSVSVFNSTSPLMLRVVKTIDIYLRTIAKDVELSIPKFNGIANLVPKNVRHVDDDIYHAIVIYLETHPNLDEIEREKVCCAMDPLKLSPEARVHASQNKKLPIQIVLHTLYYDDLQVRSGQNIPCAQSMRLEVNANVVLAKENENLRSELLKMKMFISNMEKNKVGSTSSKMKNTKKPTFFSSVSKTLGKLNPFKQGSSKDTSAIDDGIDRTKPRRRRFSMS